MHNRTRILLATLTLGAIGSAGNALASLMPTCPCGNEAFHVFAGLACFTLAWIASERLEREPAQRDVRQP